MWGQERHIQTSRLSIRIIPTRVGTSNVETYQTLPYEDHPHACGDKASRCHSLYCERGSSPRVWGQATLVGSTLPSRGIIPTRVGTRAFVSLRAKKVRDHPHACGDKAPRFYKGNCIPGSSPRVWGQVIILLRRSYRERIIPTRVGTRSIAWIV